MINPILNIFPSLFCTVIFISILYAFFHDLTFTLNHSLITFLSYILSLPILIFCFFFNIPAHRFYMWYTSVLRYHQMCTTSSITEVGFLGAGCLSLTLNAVRISVLFSTTCFCLLYLYTSPSLNPPWANNSLTKSVVRLDLGFLMANLIESFNPALAGFYGYFSFFLWVFVAWDS